ncbi:hypothetical protein N5923_14635 [Erwiniaceae bacterium BAC15a-03b]|uniref:Uncharacterized protein n=1 Tax=Winslowiella arboricola TaxID=2978220 RepID=A0A9J6PT47_9GAMM|nr:hypothetical protein [Winslowiella arboricola]MCU5773145.1 hypothetical protein [Winslowiella arboricola]MCU5778728.1 hypothetical protein [Winslowiella arboricola]
MKLLKWITLSVFTLLLMGWLFIRVIASGVDETTVYTESDFFNYHSLTDKEIEKAPRISHDYYFESHPGDGYAPSNTVIFKQASGIARLEDYLKGLGYTKERRSLGEKEIWSKPAQTNSDLFYLYFNAATGEAELTKVINH